MAFDQNGNYIPEWDESLGRAFDNEQAPNMGPFAQALKKRFAAKPNPMQQPMNHTDTSGNMGGLHESGGMSSGGMKSF